MDEETKVLTDEELEELMKQRGMEKLLEHKRFISCNGTIATGGMKYVYGRDFKLGDIVSVYSQRLNIIVNLQIYKVIKSISNGVEYFDITFGKDRLTVKNLIERKNNSSIVI